MNHVTPLRMLPPIGPHRRVVIKDESIQPTGTFKDRLATLAAKTTPSRVTFGSISYGNTAVSFSAQFGNDQSRSVVAFLPAGIESWALGPSSTGSVITGRNVISVLESLGCSTIYVDLSAKTLGDTDLMALAHERIGHDREAFVNVTEGLKVPAYAPIAMEALDQLGSQPDVCVVQYGAGILANEVRDVIAHHSPRTAVVAISTPRPDSIARMLYGPIWLDTATLQREGVAMSRHNSPDRTGATRESYAVHRIDESQLACGLNRAVQLQVSAEPSGSAGLGFLDKLSEIVPKYNPARSSVLLINTGNGIDYISHMAGGVSSAY